MARDGVIERDGWYLWRLYRNGVRYRGRASERSVAVAQRAAKLLELEREKAFGPQPKQETPGTFGAFADNFFTTTYASAKSASRYKNILEMFKARWKGRLDAITTQMIASFKAERLAVRDEETVIKEMQVIKRLFKSATATGQLQRDPSLAVKKPKAPEGRKSWQPSETFNKLMAALPDWLRPLALFAYATGARRGEILNLLWRDVDMAAGTIIFREAKAGTRVHYFNRTARTLLESLPTPIGDSMHVFPAPRTKSVRLEGNLTPMQEQERMRRAYMVKIDRAWREACLKVGLAEKNKRGRIQTRFRWHDIRHQAGSDLRRAGEDMGAVQTFLGHKTPVMTQRYVEVHPDDARRASEALDRMAPKLAPNLSEVKSESA